MDGFDLIEFEFRVADDVDFAGFGVFVYETQQGASWDAFCATS